MAYYDILMEYVFDSQKLSLTRNDITLLHVPTFIYYKLYTMIYEKTNALLGLNKRR